MKNKTLTSALFIIMCWTLLNTACSESTNDKCSYSKYVDPMIGTTRDGNQQPGARLPFGMVHFSPVNFGQKQPNSTNYLYGEKNIFGFNMVNISGAGCSNYGGILLMPTQLNENLFDIQSEYQDEKASPGYYATKLKNGSILSELTTTMRCTYARFTYELGQPVVVLNLSRRQDVDQNFHIEQISEREFAGYKQDGTFCGAKGNHTIYFYSKIKQNALTSGLLLNGEKVDSAKLSNENIGYYATFPDKKNTVIEVITGISYVSIENAKENLETEIGDQTFDETRVLAQSCWEDKLSVIQVKGGNNDDRVKFYTALYHTMSHPNVLNDVNGQYPSMGSHETKTVACGRDRYTLYSLWDTYRNVHPLFSLIYPKIQSDMVQSMVDMYTESGWLPHWELIGVEKGVMNGDPSPIVIADTYLRGIRDFDVERAYEAMIHNAEHSVIIDGGYENVRNGIQAYLQNDGYVTQDLHDEIWGCVAVTQEYNLSDWNIAQMAYALNKTEDAKKFEQRSKGYRYFWDEETQMLRPRFKDGRFRSPFDQFTRSGEQSWPNSGGPGFCEGNAWNYLFFAPHDIHYMKDSLMGSEIFSQKLTTLFENSYYEATNEPDIANPYLFNYIDGLAWKTQKYVSELVAKEFGTGPDGIPGNDDTGTMSAWLIYSMMGFYPDCPGDMDYQITSPVFDEVKIMLNQEYYNGKQFTIVKQKTPNALQYISSININEKPSDLFEINHNQITDGGILELNY